MRSGTEIVLLVSFSPNTDDAATGLTALSLVDVFGVSTSKLDFFMSVLGV